MSRIYSYQEIRDQQIPTRQQINQIVAEVQALPQFQQGNVVVFGSTALGATTWRSDIDIAYYNPPEIYLEALLNPPRPWPLVDAAALIRTAYPIACRVLGLPPRDFKELHYGCVNMFNLVSLDDPAREHEDAYGGGHERFLSPTLRDHFRMLAELKRGRYAEFYRLVPWKSGLTRTHDIRSYLEYYAMLSTFPDAEDAMMLPLGDEPDTLTYITAGRMESFPVQLMRKILGQRRRYPWPDTREQLLWRFKLLPDPWAAELLELFAPFWAFEEWYRKLVEQVRRDQITPREYRWTIYRYFVRMPWAEIYKVVQAAYPSIIEYDGWEVLSLEEIKEVRDRETAWLGED